MKLPPALLLAPPALLLAGALAAQTAGNTVDVRAAMVGQVNPATLAIWDVGNTAMNDEGGIDPALMTDESWARLADAAARLDRASEDMATAEVILSAAPGNIPDGETAGASMAEIQGYIDTDPDGFRAAAKELADYAAKLSTAALNRDADAAGDLVAELDSVCEGCHSPYWYPQQ